MKWMVMAAALAMAGVAMPVQAADRDTVMLKFAEVLATSKICPTLKANTSAMALAGLVYDIDVSSGTPDFKVLSALTQDQFTKMSDNSVEAICAAGTMMYGPKGLSAENLLIPE